MTSRVILTRGRLLLTLSRRGSKRTVTLLLMAAALPSPRARAQLTNDEVPHERIIAPLEILQEQVEASRYRLGPIRVLPRLSVDNAGYDSNVFGTSENPVSDWTATVSAGARLILPLGTKMFWTGDAKPQYTWYRTLTQRDGVGGIYDTSWLGFFNRMSVEVGGSSQETLSYLNSETETRVRQGIQAGRARVEVDLTRFLSVFAGGDAQSIRVKAPGGEPPGLVDPALFNRSEEAARGGVRIKLSENWNVSLGVEETRTSFDEVPEQRDNRSVAYLAGLFYSQHRLFVNLYGGYRVGQPENGSAFPRYSTPTGSYYVSYEVVRPLQLELYGGRRTVYGQTVGNPYYLESRAGATVSFKVLSKLSLQMAGEVGTNAYPFATVAGSSSIDRRDDYHKIGGGVSVGLGRSVIVSALVERPTYTSNVPGQDRSTLRFTTGLTLREEIAR